MSLNVEYLHYQRRHFKLGQIVLYLYISVILSIYSCISTEKFKELARKIVGTGESEMHRASWQAGDPGELTLQS